MRYIQPKTSFLVGMCASVSLFFQIFKFLGYEILISETEMPRTVGSVNKKGKQSLDERKARRKASKKANSAESRQKEYAQRKVNRQEVNAVAIGAASLPNYAIFEKTNVLQTEQILNIKWGKNFLIHRHFFIDAYLGAGVRKYKVSSENDMILHSGFLSKWKFWEVGSKGLLPNATAGFRLCLVI